MSKSVGYHARRNKRLVEMWKVCVLCGRPFAHRRHLRPTVEHLVPKSLGGKNGENLGASHARCNALRRTVSLIVAMKRLEANPPEAVTRWERCKALAEGSLVEREW